MAAEHPLGRPRAARRRGAGDQPPAASSASSTTSGSTPPTIDDFAERVPDDLVRRARSSASTRRATGCRSRPPRTTSRGGVVHRPRRRHHAARAVGVRRGRVHRRARREPAGVELAARGPGVRGACGRGASRRARRTSTSATGVLRDARSSRRAVPAVGARTDRSRPSSIRDELPARDDARRRRACASAEQPRARRRRAGGRMTPTDVEERQPPRREHARSCGPPPCREESRGTHTRSDYPGDVDRRSSGRLVFAGVAAPDVRPARRRARRSRRDELPIRRRGRTSSRVRGGVGARRGPRSARRPHRRAGAGRRARRRSTSSRAPTACSRAPRAPRRCSRSSTPTVRVQWLLDDGDARRRGHARSATCPGPLRVGAHRRAHGTQLPVPPVGRRHAHPSLRRRGRRRVRGSGTPARRCPVCARSRRRRCAPAAASTTAGRCPTSCW